MLDIAPYSDIIHQPPAFTLFMQSRERAIVPSFFIEPPGDDDVSEMVAAITQIKAFRDRLRARNQALPDALQPDQGFKHRALTKMAPMLPGFLRDRFAPSHLGILEENVRTDYNQLADHMAKLAELAAVRIKRHRALQQLVDDAKDGTASLSDIADQMRHTVVQTAGLKRIPLVEQLIGDTIRQMTPEMIAHREAETLQSLQMILDLTEPVVTTTEAGLRVGAMTLDSLARTHFVISEARQPIDALHAIARDITDSSVHTAQTPALIAYQMQQAIEGLGVALDAAQLARDVSMGGNKMDFLQTLNQKALGIAERTTLFLAPPSGPNGKP